MNTLRQILTILLIPLYLFAGAFLSEWISRTLGVWIMYVEALVQPAIGIIATFFVAPYFKVYNLIFIYVVGLSLAYWLGYPAQYPEGSAHPYQWTYRPFALTVIWATTLLAGCIFLNKRDKR